MPLWQVSLKEGKEKALDRLKAAYEKASLDDIHKCMSWWACFRKDDDMESLPDASDRLLDIPTVNPGKAQKKKNPKAKKKKRKQTKASKRKNR